MRLLLDEHLDPALAAELRVRGHDAVAVADEPALRGLSDAELFDHASARGRVIATYDARHFLPLFEERAGAGRSVAGILLISAHAYPPGAPSHGSLLRALLGAFEDHPSAAALADQAVWLPARSRDDEGRERR